MPTTIDIGDYVECDMCCKDFTNSDAKGGILFGTKGVCPECAPRIEADAERFGESQFIRGRCPDGMTFKDWVLQIRGGNNTVTIHA